MQVPELAHRGTDEDQMPWMHYGNPLFWFGQDEYCLQGRENHSLLWWHSCACVVIYRSCYCGPEKDILSVFMSFLGSYVVWSHCHFPTNLDLKYGHFSLPWSVSPETHCDLGRAVFVYWFPQFLLAGAVLYFPSSIHWYDRPPSLQYGCRTHCILICLTLTLKMEAPCCSEVLVFAEQLMQCQPWRPHSEQSQLWEPGNKNKND